jgi:hypothetical protein
VLMELGAEQSRMHAGCQHKIDGIPQTF